MKLYFFILGIISLTIQFVFLRELAISFYGNEFFIGLIISLWLLLTALGSLITSKIKFRKKMFFALLILENLFLFFSIYLIQVSNLPDILIGELPPLGFSLLFSILILSPNCFILGALFPLGVKFFEIEKALPETDRANLLNHAYFFESMGFLAAGLLSAFIFSFLPSFQIVFFLIWINVTLLFFLTLNRFPFLNLSFLVLSLLVFALTLSSLGKTINFKNHQQKFPHLSKEKYTPFGHLALTQNKDQVEIFETGSLTGTTTEDYFNENLIHPILVFRPDSKNILYLGTGFSGTLDEILKYPTVEKIDYLELNPETPDFVKDQIPHSLANPKLNFYSQDARAFLNQNDHQYDLVILNLPPPESLSVNRFYTQEIFGKIEPTLKPEGILVLKIDLPVNYLSEENQNLLTSIYQALKKNFPSIKILADEYVFLMASRVDLEHLDSHALIQTWKEKSIQTHFFTEQDFLNLLENDRGITLQNKIQKSENIPVNSDFFPQALFWQTLSWQGKFNLPLAKLWRILQENSIFIFTLLPLLPIVLLLLLTKKQKVRLTVCLLTLLAGSTIMATEIVLIFLFQTFLGNLYQKISLLIALVLLGIALGNLGGQKIKLVSTRIMILVLGILTFALLIFILSTQLIAFKIEPLKLEFFFYFWALLFGLLGGSFFTLGNRVLEKEDQSTPILYALDLLGASLGSFLISLFFIPALGIQVGLLFFAGLNALFFAFLLPQKLEP